MSDKPTVLYVDDERPNLTAFAWEFEPYYRVLVAESGERALALLEEHEVQVVIADQRMPGTLGSELLAHVRTTRPDTVRMILTGYSDIEAVIDAINRGGIYHYFSKPWKGAELRLTIDHALEAIKLGNVAAEAEHRFRETFQQTSVGIVHVALDSTRFLLANQRFCTMLGLELEELQQRIVADITHPEHQGQVEALIHDLRAEKMRQGGLEKRYIRKDGSSFWGRVSATLARAGNGTPRYFLAVVQDISEQRLAEEKLADLTEHLEDLVRERSGEMLRHRAINERLIELVVHDLKGPLAAIHSNSTLLMDESCIEGDGHEMVGEIQDCVETLNRMVLDLLDVSRSGSTSLDALRRPTAIEELLRSVMRSAEGPARLSGHRLELDLASGLGVVDIDANLISRLLQNLVDNALKYAPSGTRVLLSASREEPGLLRLSVCDEGPGIPEEHRESVFEAYARLDLAAGAQRRMSRGLGLAFCRLAARAHGGDIRCESGEQGARFVTEFPL
jgi:PAS domain S-box-containing protein